MSESTRKHPWAAWTVGLLFVALAACTTGDSGGDRNGPPASGPKPAGRGGTAGSGGASNFDNPDASFGPVRDAGRPAPVCAMSCTPEGGQYCGNIRGCDG